MRLLLTIIISSMALLSRGDNALTQTDLLYLFPNKDIYETGEDMWFKAYLMDRQTLALSDQSQTLFLQLRSENGDVVWSGKFPLRNGRGDGHVYINEAWQKKEYFIEGYTRSSFTSDSTTAIRPRRIRVVERVTQMDSISSDAVKRDSIARLTEKHRFDLFPEGGYLIDGINTVVAFKATYGDGMPEEVAGRLTENGRQIAAFKSMHDGMGIFTMTPIWGKEYRIVLSDGRSYTMPDIKPTGITMRSIRNNKAGITLLVSSTDSVAHPFTIMAKMNGIPCCSATGTVKRQKKVQLPIEKFLLQGIVQITLMVGESQMPVAERLVYVNPKQRLSINAKTDRLQYNRRDKGRVSLQVTGPEGEPVRAEMAVSIFDKDYLYQPGHENILSHCFLSEQIRGNVFNPTYYFDERNEDRLQALDLLLMTQGWRRYVWDKEPTKAKPLLSDGLKGLDRAGRPQILKAFTAEGDTNVVVSDSIGRFVIGPILMDQMRGSFYLQPLVKKPKASLLLENPFDSINSYLKGRQRYLPLNYLPKSYYEGKYVSDGFGTFMLKDVHVKGKRNIVHYDKVLEYLDSLYILSTGAWACEHNGARWLNNYLGYGLHSPLYYSICDGKRLLPKRGERYNKVLYEEHGGKIWNVACKRGPLIFHAPQFSKEELLNMFRMCAAEGYHPKKEFYEPDPIELSPTIPDPRNTLQWKPAILTDEDGKADISFMVSDVNTEFIGIVEAIDGTGLMGTQTFNFRVIRNK